MLVRVSWLSVPVPSIVFFWISFLLFCPFFPFSFFHSHSRMFAAALVFRVSIHSLSSPLSPQQCLAFAIRLIFDHSFCPMPLVLFIYLYLILYLRSIDHHILHRLRTTPTSNALAMLSLSTRYALSVHIYICCGCISAFINASWPRPFAPSSHAYPIGYGSAHPFAFAWGYTTLAPKPAARGINGT